MGFGPKLSDQTLSPSIHTTPLLKQHFTDETLSRQVSCLNPTSRKSWHGTQTWVVQPQIPCRLRRSCFLSAGGCPEVDRSGWVQPSPSSCHPPVAMAPSCPRCGAHGGRLPRTQHSARAPRQRKADLPLTGCASTFKKNRNDDVYFPKIKMFLSQL